MLLKIKFHTSNTGVIQNKDIVFLFIMLMYIESIILTSSRLLSIGPVSSKMLTSMLALVFTIPFLIFNKKYIANKYNICIIIMLFILVLSYFRAIALNQNMSLANSFMKAFIYMMFFPILLYCIDDLRKLEIIKNTIIFGGTILSIGNIVFSGICFANPALYWDIVTPLYKNGIILVLVNAGRISRLMFSGVIAQFGALFLCAALFLQRRGTKKLLVVLLNLAGIFLTYTRGIYAGVLIGGLFFICKAKRMNRKAKQNLYRLFAYAFFLIVCVLALSVLTGRDYIILYAFQRLFSLDIFSGLKLRDNFFGGFDYELNAMGNDIRTTMMEKLYKLISLHPIIGSGAGAHIDYRDGKVEMLYHDIISKIGIIGLVIFLAPLIKMMYIKINWRNEDGILGVMRIGFLSTVVAVFVSSYSNPYAMGALGIFLYCLCMRLYSTSDFPIENKFVAVRRDKVCL